MTRHLRASRGRMAHAAGDAAEQRIAQDYERRGFTVAHRRWRSQSGELDLVLRKGAQIVFVEVKKSRSFARAAEYLSPRQQARIARTAECFLADSPTGLDSDVRFDVALMNETGQFEILENALGFA